MTSATGVPQTLHGANYVAPTSTDLVSEGGLEPLSDGLHAPADNCLRMPSELLKRPPAAGADDMRLHPPAPALAYGLADR
jgi:hypothetical protein